MTDLAAVQLNEKAKAHRNFLFVACFIALVATAFAFVIRSFILDDLRVVFNLTETQKGEINGAGFWPFAISIVVFSLIIDKIGYGKAMIFAFVCHVGSVALMFLAKGYWTLYFSAALCALAAGTVEAVINPVIASMFPKNKTKMLTILHAGWAGGICLAGALTLSLTPSVAGWIKEMGMELWQLKAGLLLIPTFTYGIMMLFCKFPINERVAAGVPYRDMLKEAGALSILIVSFMIFKQVGALGMPAWAVYTAIGVCSLGMLAYTRSLGRPMYVFLLLVMILLAITEISTDGWIKDLMGPAMAKLKLDGGWVLVYTSFLMMILRFGISPFVKVLKPLGVLLMGSLFAAAGLFFLSSAQGVGLLLLFATIYGIGQAFFWPVTIGLVAEQFPRGGALTINAIAGVGMLATGIIGFPLLGILQDKQIDRQLEADSALVAFANPEETKSVLGSYYGLNSNMISLMQAQKDLAEVEIPASFEGEDVPAAPQAVRDAYELLGGENAQTADYAQMVAFLTEAGATTLPAGGVDEIDAELAQVDEIRATAKQKAMAQIAILPLIMAGCYIGLIIYFRAKGGYKAVDLSTDGEVVGAHAVTPTEAVADAEATPSE
jgi:MFS family permease